MVSSSSRRRGVIALYIVRMGSGGIGIRGFVLQESLATDLYCSKTLLLLTCRSTRSFLCLSDSIWIWEWEETFAVCLLTILQILCRDKKGASIGFFFHTRPTSDSGEKETPLTLSAPSSSSHTSRAPLLSSRHSPSPSPPLDPPPAGRS